MKLADKITTIVKEAYLANLKKEKNISTFEEEIESLITSSFLTTFGTGSFCYSPSKNELKRWGKNIEEVAEYIRQEGFFVQVIKGKHIDISHLTLRDEVKELKNTF